MALGVGGWAEVRPGFERIVEGRMGGVHVLRCMHPHKKQITNVEERGMGGMGVLCCMFPQKKKS